MKRYWIILIVVLVSVATACNSAPVNQTSTEGQGEKVSVTGGTYTNISVAELQAMLKNKDFILVNTHIPYEGDLPNTDLSIPFDQIEGNLDKLPANKDTKIVLYCRSDRMSTIASETLVGLGYTNIWNLEGGMVAWEQQGLPLMEK